MSVPPIPWDKLAGSAQDAVIELVHLCAERFTGRVEIDVSDGAVLEFRRVTRDRPADLGRRRSTPQA